MQHFPLLDLPTDILFLILYELSVEDLLSLVSVSSLIIRKAAPLLIRHRADLQGASRNG
jgi:hypothetical protein